MAAIQNGSPECILYWLFDDNALTKGKPWSAARRLAWLQSKET
jgi:hypothetical protein